MTEFSHLQDTAYYVFDTRVFRQRIKDVQGLLGQDIALAYAIKANPFLAGFALPEAKRLEICSPGESHICDALDIPAEATVISGLNKTPAFIEELVKADTAEKRIYTVESLTQFELLDTLAAKYGKKLQILLRLTNDSQFGINEEEIESLVRCRGDHPNLHYLGIQFFSGTQKTSLKKLSRELRHLDGLLQTLEETGWHCPELEYGPGFPVSYFGEELDEQALIKGFRGLLDEMTWKGSVTLELGRSLAASCGRYFTHVADRKINHGQGYLVLDGGMHQMVYFGQYMGMKMPAITLCGKEDAPVQREWNLCGSLCSMNDILVKACPLPEIQIGDTLCFHNTGAYCVTEGIALFLSRDLPAVYLVTPDGSVTRARETTQTYPMNMAPKTFPSGEGGRAQP